MTGDSFLWVVMFTFINSYFKANMFRRGSELKLAILEQLGVQKNPSSVSGDCMTML